MTLVIAGHQFNKYFKDRKDGLFVVADSNITLNNNVLVNGFKKVIETPIKLKNISFSGQWFNGYSNNYLCDNACFLAFSGNTLVAQHILNSIKNHLGELYPIYENGNYRVAMPCERKKHLEQANYSEDIFTKKHLENILTGEYLSNVVDHSIQKVLDQAQKHGVMKTKFSAYQAEFLLGLQCPFTKQHQLYQYEIVPDVKNNGAKVKKEIIPEGKVGVIGMRKEYLESANRVFSNAKEKGVNTARVIHKFVSDSIDTQNSKGNNNIGKPCGLYLLEKDKYLTLEKTFR